MSISDWSSDVCSSDHVARAMREPRFARPRVARDEPIERALHRRLAALAPDVGDHRPVRDMVETLAIKAAQQIALIRIATKSIAARHRFQNGRASCGERVCQYV